MCCRTQWWPWPPSEDRPNLIFPQRPQKQARSLLFIWVPLLLVASSCQAGPVASADGGSLTATVRATHTKPVVVYTVAAPADLPSFALLNPTELAATSAANALVVPTPATPTPQGSQSATPEGTPLPTELPMPTPMPTFTPPALPLTSTDEHYWLRRPVADGGVVWTDKSYPYGHTRGGTLRPHHGVEFNVPRSTEILAAASGTVVVAGSDDSVAYGPIPNFYGNVLVIELDSRLAGQSVFNLYGHLSEILVQVGQHVGAQEAIALSGASGMADGPHLHFEVRLGTNDYDSTRNPLLWLYPFKDRGTVAGRVLWPGGELVHEAPVQLRRIDAPARYAATTTYAPEGVNADDGWRENFAFDDVEAGYYNVIVETGEEKYVGNVWVFSYRTNFVEITLDASSKPADQ